MVCFAENTIFYPDSTVDMHRFPKPMTRVRILLGVRKSQ